MKTSMMMVVALAAVSVWANTPPEITNVRAGQREGTKLVDIYYDAADADGDSLKIRVEISDNDGAKYSVPALTFTGDIGEGVTPGINKHIVWDAGTDWDGEYSDQMRVKIYAIDAKGFPGLEWGNEVPPGGFLLGQDGGAEGSGPSKHINIPWSYWLSKYEITAQQFCDFINVAVTSGLAKRQDTTAVLAGEGISPLYACPIGEPLCAIGDSELIRWNVSKFEVNDGCANYPANVTWYGAMAFAKFYGYDLPTESEWEKAARGPSYDDQDEHLCYPWGNEVSLAYANITPSQGFSSIGYYDGNQVPVGPDTVNEYGLYDVIGNAAEWTRSMSSLDVESYLNEETLMTWRNLVFASANRIVRGTGSRPIYARQEASQSAIVCDYYYRTGFRVVRRNAGVKDIESISEGIEDFSSWGDCGYLTPGSSVLCTKSTPMGDWKLALMTCRDGVVTGSSAWVSGSEYSGSAALCLPEFDRQVYCVRIRVRCTENAKPSIVCQSSRGESKPVYLEPYMDDFVIRDLYPVHGADNYRLMFGSSVQLDSVEVFTIPKNGYSF